MARAEAVERGADEALLLNTNGEVAETASGNLFWVHDNIICTVPTECGVLPGITRAVVFGNLPDDGSPNEPSASSSRRHCGISRAFSSRKARSALCRWRHLTASRSRRRRWWIKSRTPTTKCWPRRKSDFTLGQHPRLWLNSGVPRRSRPKYQLPGVRRKRRRRRMALAGGAGNRCRRDLVLVGTRAIEESQIQEDCSCLRAGARSTAAANR